MLAVFQVLESNAHHFVVSAAGRALQVYGIGHSSSIH